MTEHDAADGTREVARGERRERNHQRDERRGIGKDRVGDVLCENTEDDEIVELERAAQAREQHDTPTGRADAARGERRVGNGGCAALHRSIIAS